MSNSKEYEEGFLSIKYSNPYKIGTQAFNDFERGWVQRLKRNLPVELTLKADEPIYSQKSREGKASVLPIESDKRTFKSLLKKYGLN
ncbi:hypothetical protein [Rheinheimera salexigens]|uniref:Uncharacterized protein n=1 Tax=Rheinheimera salexigens TaxID=1628148 RepID=A0A1E7Q7B5_9GAMM|nr:hypothetical protein [Rheinheimera salexigens]OEY70017.1 hypothetical protein BI198_10900 [Rheinheimera salexigens]